MKKLFKIIKLVAKSVNIEENVQAPTEKVDKRLSLVDIQQQYSKGNSVFIHGLKDNHIGDTKNVVINLISNEMYLQISLGNIDLTHEIEVPNSCKNRCTIVIFVQYNGRRQILTNNIRCKGKD